MFEYVDSHEDDPVQVDQNNLCIVNKEIAIQSDTPECVICLQTIENDLPTT